MSRESKTLKLLKTIEGTYKPQYGEVLELAKLAKMNKLYLAYLRAVSDVFRNEYLRVEAKYRWFMRNVVEVVEALKDLNYALFKFRKPVEHVSVDLDILIDRRDIPRAVQRLKSRGFEVISPEPYTVTLARRGFVIDLYTEPSFAWIVYMDGRELLKNCVEESEVNGVWARALCREAEVVVAAAHAVYKEHIVLSIDCLLLWSWMNSKVRSIAIDLGVEKALKESMRICNLVRKGYVETPYKLELNTIVRVYMDKMVRDPSFRGTLPNILKYIFLMQGSGKRVLTRLARRSY